MKFIIKISKYSLLQCCLIITFAAIPIVSFAQDVVDFSSPQDPLVEPAIVMTSSTIQPDCHTYTGCGLIVVNQHYYYPPKHYKHRRHHIYHQSCCAVGDCYYVSPGIDPYWDYPWDR